MIFCIMIFLSNTVGRLKRKNWKIDRKNGKTRKLRKMKKTREEQSNNRLRSEKNRGDKHRPALEGQ